MDIKMVVAYSDLDGFDEKTIKDLEYLDSIGCIEWIDE